MRAPITAGFLMLAACGCDRAPSGNVPGPTDAPSTIVGHVRVTGCASGGVGANASQLISALGHVEYCWLQSDGGITIQLAARPGSALTIDGDAVVVGPDGTASYRVSLDPLILGGPVRQVLTDGAGLSPRRLEVRLGDGPAPQIIEVHPGRATPVRARDLLDAASRGQPLAAGVRGGDAEVPAPTPTRRSLVYLPPERYRTPVHHGRLGRLDEVGLVAVARDREPRDGGLCGPYGDGAPSRPRQLIDVTVVVHDTTTSEPVTERTFESGAASCPTSAPFPSQSGEPVESRPSDQAIGRWLEEVIREPPR